MIYIFLADGFEEVEAITPRDILKRAGVSVQTVGLNQNSEVSSTSGLKIIPDMQIENINFDDTKLMSAEFRNTSLKNIDLSTSEIENAIFDLISLKGLTIRIDQAYNLMYMLGVNVK